MTTASGQNMGPGVRERGAGPWAAVPPLCGRRPRTRDRMGPPPPRCSRQRKVNSHREGLQFGEAGQCPGQGRDRAAHPSPARVGIWQKLGSTEGAALCMWSRAPLQRSRHEPMSPSGLQCQNQVSKQGWLGTSREDPPEDPTRWPGAECNGCHSVGALRPIFSAQTR